MTEEYKGKFFIFVGKGTRSITQYYEAILFDFFSLGLQGCLADEFLLRFLRAKKFNQDNAFRLYTNYYILRLRYPDIFNDLRPSLVEHVFQSGVVCRLPQPDSEGRALIYFRPGLWNPAEWSTNDIFRANVLVIEELLLVSLRYYYSLVFDI